MLRLSPAHAHQIRREAERAYPSECCGVLIGVSRGGVKHVLALHPTRNVREDAPEHRYAIAPDDLLAAELAARARGAEVIGYYHSHPDAPPTPSAYDRAHAWPWVGYLIVAVAGGRAAEMSAWVRPETDAPFRAVPVGVGGAERGAEHGAVKEKEEQR